MTSTGKKIFSTEEKDSKNTEKKTQFIAGKYEHSGRES